MVLILAPAGLQYRLWVGDGSLAQVRNLQKQIAGQHDENECLLERNRVLETEVVELKRGTETIEERARHKLGMVEDGETLYQLTRWADSPSPGDDFRPSRLLDGDPHRRRGFAHTR